MIKSVFIFISSVFIQAGIKDVKPITVENVRKEISAYQIQHEDIVLAQAILETGWFECKNCSLQSRNLFGWSYDGVSYIEFKHWEESIGLYKIWQSENYKGGDYYDFLEEVGYAADSMYTSKLKVIVKSIKEK